MKNIKTKTLTSIVGIISVLVFFLWGFLADDWSHSWMALIVGGLIAAVVRLIGRDIEDANNDEKQDKKE